MNEELKKEIEKLRQELKDFYLVRNPLLKKMKKENWIVNVHNKAMICWAGIHTLELLEKKIKEKK